MSEQENGSSNENEQLENSYDLEANLNKIQDELFRKAISEALLKNFLSSDDALRRDYLERLQGDHKILSKLVDEQIAPNFRAIALPLFKQNQEFRRRFIEAGIEIEDPNLIPEDTLVALKVAMHFIVENALELNYKNWEVGLALKGISGLPGKLEAERSIKKMIRAEKDFAFAFFDLDHLGALNEALGEENTNRVLRLLGQRIQEKIRTEEPEGKNDGAFHAHGDEFYLIFNNCNLEKGKAASEKLLNAINSAPFTLTVDGELEDYIRSREGVLRKKIEDEESKPEGEEKKDVQKYRDGLKLIEGFLFQLNNKTPMPNQREENKGEVISFLNIDLTASLGVTAVKPQEIDGRSLSNEELKLEVQNIITNGAMASKLAKDRGRNQVVAIG